MRRAGASRCPRRAAEAQERAFSDGRSSVGGPQAGPLDDTRISERGSPGGCTALTSRRSGIGQRKGGAEGGEQQAPPAPAADDAADRRWKREAEAASRADWFPRHVRACLNNPQRSARWTLAVWPKQDPTQQTRIAYTCGSYRCPCPECQRAAAHRDFAKIRDGLATVGAEGSYSIRAHDGQPIQRSGWLFVVLTIDFRGTLTGKPWHDEQQAFRELSRMSRNFLARLRRYQKARGHQPTGNRWVSTVEVQGNGWPHLNLMIWAPDLALELDREQDRLRRRGIGETAPAVVTRLRGKLRTMATAVGWGPVGHASPAERDPEALAGYLVKIGASMERKAGEIAKLCQAPRNARMKLRRLRAGKGFIPRDDSPKRYTGTMLKRGADDWGPTVEPMIQPDQVKMEGAELERYCDGVRRAIRAEMEQYRAELSGAPEAPIVRPERPERPPLVIAPEPDAAAVLDWLRREAKRDRLVANDLRSDEAPGAVSPAQGRESEAARGARHVYELWPGASAAGDAPVRDMREPAEGEPPRPQGAPRSDTTTGSRAPGSREGPPLVRACPAEAAASPPRARHLHAVREATGPPGSQALPDVYRPSGREPPKG